MKVVPIERTQVATPGVGFDRDNGDWTAILLAGQRPGGDPLAEHCGVKYKALIEIGGQTMLRRVADTLLASPSIGRVVILAQSPNDLVLGDTAALASHPRVSFITSNDGIATSVAAVAGSEEAPWPVLVTTADNALLTPDTVSAFLSGSSGHDIAVGVVERKTVMATYPATRRTWLKFRDGAYSGANLFALCNARVEKALALWACVEQDRKKSWKIFACFGPWLLLRALTRTMSFATALDKAGQRVSATARPVVLEIADAAIDVDKPTDLTLVRRILHKRSATARHSSRLDKPLVAADQSPVLISLPV